MDISAKVLDIAHHSSMECSFQHDVRSFNSSLHNVGPYVQCKGQ